MPKISPPTTAELYELYHVRQMSTPALVTHYGVSKGTIYNWMKSLGVPARTMGQANVICKTGWKHTQEMKDAIGRAHQGTKHSPEAVSKMRAALTGRKCKPLSDDQKRKLGDAKRGKPLSEAHRAAISRTRKRMFAEGLIEVIKSQQGYSRFKRGHRDDIGIYVRSSWEANYARILQWKQAKGQILKWEYEPYTFVFGGVSRGVVSYLPDFRITHLDGSIEFIEVKGRETSKDRTKWRRMKQFYPHVKLTVVGADTYKSLSHSFGGLPNWER